MQPESGRVRQFNLRLSDAEAAALALLAAQDGVTPSEFLRLHIRQTVAERQSGRRRRLPALHLDILTTLAQDRAVSADISHLMNRVSAVHAGPWLGREVSDALVELEHLGHVQRAPVPGRAYLITVSGMEIAKSR